MSSTSIRSRTRARLIPVRDTIVIVGVLILAALFLFVDHAPRPIFLWDESRNIVNALEMDQYGFGVVPTYDGTPDLWNTKPPLLIWLMVGSVRAFGASLWALRLPGMIATLGTVAIVMVFVRRTTGSIGTAALAAALFVASPALFGEHGARTADYDSLLVFFATGYLILLFGTIHRARPRAFPLMLAACCILGAILTKSVAGIMPGVGVAAYLVVTHRLSRVVDWRYAAAGVAIGGALLPIVVGEWQVPGYLASSWHNDVGGRWSGSLVGAARPPAFYLQILWRGYFTATPLLIFAPFVSARTRGRTRAALRYSLCVVVAVLAVATMAASKLHHYILPALPFMSVAAAITVRTIWRRLTDRRPDEGVTTAALAILCVVSLAVGAERAIVQRYVIDPPYEGARSGGYGALFDRIVPQVMPVVAVDPGFADHGDPHYAPVLRAYLSLWERRGTRIDRVTAIPDIPPARPIVAASCDPATTASLQHAGDIVALLPGCAAVLLR